MKKLLLTLLLVLTGVGTAMADTVEITGDSRTWRAANMLPTNSSQLYALSQQLYTKEEIGMAGTVRSIAFYKTSTPATNRYLEIYMSPFRQSEIGGPRKWTAQSTVTRVFSGEVVFPEGTGWVTIQLEEPYEYGQNESILLTVDDNTAMASDAGLTFRTFTASNSQASRYKALSDNNPDPTNDTQLADLTGTVSNVKNAIQLGIDPLEAGTVKVGSGANTASNLLPTYGPENYGITQQLYFSYELKKAGTIHAISFKTSKSSWRTQTKPLVDIYLTHSTKGFFTDGNDWEPIQESDLVYSGEIPVDKSGSLVRLELDKPFNYDGIYNMVLTVVKRNRTIATGTHPQYLTYEDANTAISTTNPRYAYDITQLSSYTGTLLNEKNQVWFDITESAVTGDRDGVSDQVPLATAQKNSMCELIYTSDEIGRTGFINSLSFFCESSTYPDAANRYISVYVADYWVDNFSSGSDWYQMGDYTFVFGGKVTLKAGQWITIPFNKPFKYEGKNNLIVGFDDNTDALSTVGSNTNTFKFAATSTSEAQAIYANSEWNVITPTYTLGQKGNTLQQKPVMMFTFQKDWEIGQDGQPNVDIPTGTLLPRSLTQQIYTHEELGKDQADITSLSYYNAGATCTRQLDIYMTSPLSGNTFETGGSWLPVATSDLVFSGDVTFTANSWTEIPLNKTYHYNAIDEGTHDLLITVNDKTATQAQDNPSFLAYSTETPQTFVAHDLEAQPYDPTDLADVRGIAMNVKNQLRLNDRPINPKPLNFHVVSGDFHSVTLAWNDLGIDNKMLKLAYRRANNSSSAWQYITIGSTNGPTSYTLTGLEANTAYVIDLQIDSYSNNEWARIQYDTDIKPSVIEATDITPYSATITWKGYAQKWDVQYQAEDGDGWDGKSATSQTSLDLTGLQPYTLYNVRIRATDGENEQSSWATYSFRTAEVYPRPSDLYVAKKGDDYAVLKWTENGDGKAWEICIDGDEDNLLRTGITSYTLTSLQAATTYSVQVRAIVENGTVFTHWSEPLSFTTRSSFASFEDVNAEATATTATISWDSQCDSFELFYRKLAGEPLQEGFEENGFYLPTGWTSVDADGDGFSWRARYGVTGAHSGKGELYSESWSRDAGNKALTPDNWLISPQVQLGGSVSAWLRGYDVNDPAEHFAFYVSTSGTSPSDFVQVSEEFVAENNFVEYTVDLSSFAGSRGYIAIRHFNCTNQYQLVLDDVTITEGTEDWQTVEVGGLQTTLTGLQPGSDYEFKLVGHKAGKADVETDVLSFRTLDSRIAPTDFAVLPINGNAEITWKGESESYFVRYREAEVTKTTQRWDIYLHQDFEDGMGDWTTIDREQGSTIKGSADDHYWSFDYTREPPQYLISPLLNGVPEGAQLSFRYWNLMSDGPESFKVGYSTTDNKVASFVWTDEITAPEDTYIHGYKQTLPAGVKYICIQCTSYNQYELHIDDIQILHLVETTTTAPGPWMDEETDEPKVVLTGLKPETKYDYFVQGLTEGEEAVSSDIQSFTMPGEAIELALDNQIDNFQILAANDGAYANVTLRNITLRGDGQWQTISLPFDVDVASSPLADADVRTLESVTEAGDELCILNCLTPVSRIKAGAPYIIRRKDAADITDPVFPGVVVNAVSGSPIDMLRNKVTFGNNNYAFLTYPAADNYLAVTGSPILEPFRGPTDVYAFDAFFQMSADLVFRYRTFVLNTGEEDDLITSSPLLTSPKEEETAIYNLAGQRLAGTQKGINIVAGRKVLVK